MQQPQLLSQAVKNSSALKLLLEQEFESLKVQDLTTFDGLQDKKLEILTLLTNDDMAKIVNFIDEAIMNHDNEDKLKEIGSNVNSMMSKFPLFSI